MGTVNSLSGTLPATLTYSARKWFWVPAVPGAYPDDRDGTLTIILVHARGGRIERDSYGVQEDTAAFVMGRAFLLVNDIDDTQPDAYRAVIGPHPSCTCTAGNCHRSESCKHMDALAALVVELLGGPTKEESGPVVTVTATVVEPLALPAAAAPQPEPQPPALVPASAARQDLKPIAPSTRRPPKARKVIAEKTVRVAVDPVTHVKTVTVLDDVQKAFEQATRGIEGALLKLSNGDVQRVIPRLEEWLRRMKPHSD